MSEQRLNTDICRAVIPSPVGPLLCAATSRAVILISYETDHPLEGNNPLLACLRKQMDEYFAGTRQNFDIPFEFSAGETAHRLKVWNALRGIPYGKTVTYRQIAEQTGSSPIAVGQAVRRNPVSILLPCHRVIGSDGSLTGYNGGLERKRFLLRLEADSR